MLNRIHLWWHIYFFVKMSGKTLKFDVDGDNCISLTMSDSGRISLSDITAATIGSLEDVCWNNDQQPGQDARSIAVTDCASPPNVTLCSTEISSTTDFSKASDIPTSTTQTNTSDNLTKSEYGNQAAETWSALKTESDFNFHTGTSVLRPWESESAAKRSDNSSYQPRIESPHNDAPSQSQSNPPPSYHEHIKRHYDTPDSNKENQASKRFRMDQTPRPNHLSDQISSFYRSHSYKPATDSGLFCAQSAQNRLLSGAGLPGVSETTNQISSFYKSAKNSPLSNVGVSNVTNQISSLNKHAQNIPLSDVGVSDATNQISSFYKTALNSPLSCVGVSNVTNQIASFNKSAQNSTLSSEGLSNVTNQISSFYKSAQNSPISARCLPPVSEAFSYPALSNFVKQEPASPLVKVQQQTASATSLYQPWSASPNMTPVDQKQLQFGSLQAPQASSHGSVKFLGQSLGFLEAPSPQPHTPQSKTKMNTQFTVSLESPGVDSRMNDSLSLLGSPQVDNPLSKHPYFGDLKALLSSECKRETVPQSLFHMQQEKESSQPSEPESVFSREQKLQERFSKLQPRNPDEVRQMSSFFRYQTALIETERFKTLHECKYPGSYKDSINSHFDDKLHQVMDRVEKSVELLEKANSESKPSRSIKPRPHLRREAVQLMEAWYAQNLEHPYPTPDTVEQLARAGNAGVEQVKKWFANKRNRSQNTRTLTEIAMKKRRLGQLNSS